MNAQVTELKELTVVERASRALSKAESEAKLKELAEQSKAIVAVTDPASRLLCHESLMVLKNIRRRIETTGKEAREDATAYSRAVIAEEKRLIAIIEPEERRLAQIRDEWDSARERERQERILAEQRRVEAIQARIESIRAIPVKATGFNSQKIAEALKQADEMVIGPEFEEFAGKATEALEVSRAALMGLLQQRLQHEAEQERILLERAELAQLRAAEEERQRLAKEAQAKAVAAAKAEREREEAAAKAALEELRRQDEAERKAQYERQVAEARAHAEQLRLEREKNARQTAIRQAELDKQAEAQRAEEARIAAQRAELEREQERAVEQRLAAEQAIQEAKRDAERKASQKFNMPRGKAKRPTDAEIVQALAIHFRVHESKVVEWLLEMDLSNPELSKP